MVLYIIREVDKIEYRIIYNYLLIVFEELVINVILYKEYDIFEYVGIYIYRDRIFFVNYNRFLFFVIIEVLNNNRSFDKR